MSKVSKEELEAFWKGDKDTYQRMYALRMQLKADKAERQGKKVTYVANDGSGTLPEVTVTAPRETEELKQTRLKLDYENLVDNAITVAGVIPVVDTYADILDIGNSLKKGDYNAALFGLGATFIPGVSAPLLRRGYNWIKDWISIKRINNLMKDVKTPRVSTPTLTSLVYQPVTQQSSRKTALHFYQRSSKLSDVERKGIPKGDRNNIEYYYSAMTPNLYLSLIKSGGISRLHPIFGYKDVFHAIDHSKEWDNPIIVKFSWPKDAKVAPTIDNLGKIWFDVNGKLSDLIGIDNAEKGFDVTKINNIDELGYLSDIAIVHNYVPTNNKKVNQDFILKVREKYKLFKSDLDWNPESWFSLRSNGKFDEEDVESLQNHILEYLDIERIAKAKGNFNKLQSGKMFTGDSREWVMSRSKNAINLDFDNYSDFQTGQKYLRSFTFPFEHLDVWLTNRLDLANKFAQDRRNPKGAIYRVFPQKNNKIFEFNANNLDWDIITGYKDGYVSTNYIVNDRNEPLIRINNVLEGSGGPLNLSDDLVIKKSVQRKSLLGNNGNLDMENSNIYKKFGGKL